MQMDWQTMLIISAMFMAVGYVQGRTYGISIGKMAIWVLLIFPFLLAGLPTEFIISGAGGMVLGFVIARPNSYYLFEPLYLWWRRRHYLKRMKKERNQHRFDQERQSKPNQSKRDEQARKRAEENADNDYSSKQENVNASSDQSNPNQSHKDYEDLKRQAEQAKQEARRSREEARRSKEEADKIRQSQNVKPKDVPDTRSPEEVLGLKPGFTPADLKKAYKREAGRFHESKWANKPEVVKKAMLAELKRINVARDELEKKYT